MLEIYSTYSYMNDKSINQCMLYILCSRARTVAETTEAFISELIGLEVTRAAQSIYHETLLEKARIARVRRFFSNWRHQTAMFVTVFCLRHFV